MLSKTLSADQISRLLDQQESHFLDFKSAEISPAKLSKSLAAFANADGGELFVGIEDEKRGVERWNGFENPESANGLIQVLNDKFPVGTAFNILS